MLYGKLPRHGFLPGRGRAHGGGPSESGEGGGRASPFPAPPSSSRPHDFALQMLFPLSFPFLFVPHGAWHCHLSEIALNALTAFFHVLHPCFKHSEIQLLLCDSISNLQHSVKSESSSDLTPLSGALSSPQITSLLVLRLLSWPAARACLLSARSVLL